MTEMSGNAVGGRKTLLLLGAGLLLLAAVGAGIWLGSRPSERSGQHTLRGITRGQTDFAAYYPSKLPKGYSFKEASATVTNGILTYQLVKDDNEIMVNQQARPQTSPNISYLVDFHPIKVTGAVNAVLGKNGNIPVAIVEFENTLIIMRGSASISGETLGGLAKTLRRVD